MLQDKAMLVDVSLSAYTPHKKSRRMQHAAATGLNVNEDYVIASKRLASKDHFKKLVTHDGKVRQFIYAQTRPWLDNSWRMLPTASYFDFTDGINVLFSDREKLVEELASIWPAIKDESRIALNGEFDESDFPDDIRSKYSADVMFMPIPRSGDFRIPEGIDASDVEKIEADTLAKIQEQFSSKDLWKRIYDELTTQSGTIGDRLRQYGTDGNGNVVNKFHDTLITNINDLIERLPKLNIADDPMIADIQQKLENEICVWEPQVLRDNEVLREDVAAKADQILAEVAAFMA